MWTNLLTKHRMMILIIVTGVIIVIGNFLDYIPSDTNKVLRIIIVFIVFISWYLIEVFKTQDENMKKYWHL